jgi:hypothetical protein
MPPPDKLILYYKLYQLVKILYRAVKNFPKEYKYSLGGNIIDLAWRCLDLVWEANGLVCGEKKSKIDELSVCFDKLKLRIRMSQELDLISIGLFSRLEADYLSQIGRMIGGWKKWIKYPAISAAV